MSESYVQTLSTEAKVRYEDKIRLIDGVDFIVKQQHSTAQHSTAPHSTAQHSTAQHSTAQHSTAQQYSTT